MIITAIRAKNVLKYTELKLENLPEKGIIAISGHNESGKSTIGETVCFALFARTFSLKPEDLHKIIRWGEESCSVILNFRIENQEYSLYRYLDENGTHAAKLLLTGSEDTPLARSPQQVDAVLANILGYTFEEFIESFYLAQREITSPHPHGKAVKTIAGVEALEQVSMEYERDVAAHNEMLEEIQTGEEALQDELEELGLQEGYLEVLENDKNKLETDLAIAQGLAGDLKTDCDHYIANEDKIKKALANRGRVRLLRLLSLLLALTAGGVWALISQNSELPLTIKLVDFLEQNISTWQDSYIGYAGTAAAVSALLFLLFWILSASLGVRIKAINTESAKLASVMELVRSVEEYEYAAETSGTEDEEEEPVTTQGITAQRYDAEKYAALMTKVASAKAPASDVVGYAATEQQWLAEQILLRELTLGQTNRQIAEETERVSHAVHLQNEIAGLQSRAEELTMQLDLWEKCIELLAGASKHFSRKFNRDIRDLMASTLPVFTQGHYEHLQIQPGLGVRVFSNDKYDYLDMDEISSGTQRQIMLALRLAMAQKLMGSTVKGRQFAFLDEPFAFFDEERTRHALEALDELSDAISQIWIVAQTFPQGHEFATEIKCSRDNGKLAIDAKTISNQDYIYRHIRPGVVEPELADT